MPDNPTDVERLAEIRSGMRGRTQYEGRPERTDEFLSRLLDEREAAAQSAREAALEEAIQWHDIEYHRIRLGAAASRITPKESAAMRVHTVAASHFRYLKSHKGGEGSAGSCAMRSAPAQSGETPMPGELIVWTAKEALACALCWSEFSRPEDRPDTPEAYWLAIGERTRQSYRASTKHLGLVSVARCNAVALPRVDDIAPDVLRSFANAARLQNPSRIRHLAQALYAAMKAEKPRPSEIGGIDKPTQDPRDV